jgi:3-oxoacyl-[acyl-carrier protein] reductase
MCKLLYGKTAIITGSNRGIGKAICELFAREGADIYACARKRTDEFEKDVSELSKGNSVSIKPVYFDLSSEDEIKRGIKAIISEKKNIDVLVNNAGIADGGILTMTSMSRLKEVFEVNYFAPVQIMQLVAHKMMKQKSGSIINIASVAGLEAQPGYLSYGSSKASLIWATRSVGKELGQYGIRVNAIAPGMVKTDMGGKYKTEDELMKTIERTGLRRMGTPDEIANAALFLASDESSFVNGEILQVDGGRI